MGNGISGPKLPVEEIQEVAAEVSRTFSPAYVLAFCTNLIKDIKRSKTKTARENLLEAPGPASAPLFQGALHKLGAIRKSWKQRYFIVKNEADNFAVEYYTDAAAAAAGKQAKGSINLCWYRVERCTSDEDKAANGEFSVRLSPWWRSDRRRVWCIRAESEAALDAFIGAAEVAARKADPPLNPDPVLRAAFKEAMTQTRRKLGEYGWFYFAMTEAEQLAVLVVDRCERGCMRDVYAKLPAGSMNSVVRTQVQKSLDSTVGAATSSAWRAASSSLTAQKPELRKRADESIGPIFELQAQLQMRIRDAVDATLSPALRDGVAPLLGALAAAFWSTLLKAYEQVITIFNESMTAAAASSAEDATTWESALAAFERDTFFWYGKLRAAFTHIRNLTQYGSSIVTGIGATAAALSTQEIASFLSGVELWQVEREFEEGVRKQARSAVHTLRTRTTGTSATASKADAIARTVGELIHDAKLQAFTNVQAIFTMVVLAPIEKDVLPAALEMITPLTDAVPEALKTFINPSDMLEELMHALLADMLQTALLPSAQESLTLLDSLAPAGVTVKPLKGPAPAKSPAASTKPSASASIDMPPAATAPAAAAAAAAVGEPAAAPEAAAAAALVPAPVTEASPAPAPVLETVPPAAVAAAAEPPAASATTPAAAATTADEVIVPPAPAPAPAPAVPAPADVAAAPAASASADQTLPQSPTGAPAPLAGAAPIKVPVVNDAIATTTPVAPAPGSAMEGIAVSTASA